MSGSVRSGHIPPHSRRESTDSYASSVGSNRALRPPKIEMAATSPLSKIGIKGDGLMLFITCFASIGVFLFGYDQGVMSGIITGPHFRAYFREPTSYEIGTMVAILEIGALCTSLACGTLADIFGRKKVLFWGAILFSIGGAIQTFTTGFTSMVIGRVIAGFGVGTLSMIVPTYQSEISPAENRGMLACIEFTGNIAGYAASVWIDYFCSYINSDLSWRLPLSIQVLIGLTLAFGSLLLPESPRWLLDHDQDEEGMRVLADLHGGGNPREPRARLEYREIKENVLTLRKEPDRSYTAMFRRYRCRTWIACSSQMFAQLNGINVISYYAPLVFESAGWLGRDALLMTGINGIIYILSTVPTWFLVDTWGRRPILLSGSVLMAISLALCGYFLYLDAPFTAKAVVGCVIVFNAAFGFSWGPIPWLLPSEIMPLAFRAKGASLSTATNWAFNFIIGEGTPILQEKIKWRLYPMHAFFCTCSFILVFFMYPETMGVPLEEMDQLFGDEPSAVPQGDDSDDEDDEEAARPVRPIRTSISSHPRFMNPEERAARAAAARVAAEDRARAESAGLFGIKRLIGRLLGANASEPDRRLYQSGFGPSSIPLEDITSSNAARHRKKDGTKKGGKRKGKTPSGIETSRPTTDLPTNDIPAETDYADEETQFKLGDSDDDEGEGSGAKGQTGPGVNGRDDSDEDDLEWESGRR
ncbi:unnamed protein product [Tilletia controversa]|uniref:Major facilitator superfamily (MFS) profile domain-containing protein n=3 Tax=Tilletia TaxID=13289 RepID=A0A8X7N0H2_9BASI|nr:hypothetical protein CF336_g567 [Tilletia laevis]KAE8204978.1 hypothetical protein CF328_g763 [Tilletia controversa]KAE8265331.1 hypothetical protein A4X03_0g338 [Tilletia caries]KAE8208646.1 hypothetical protein CF335_g263 [Tilletia laevis]KAE8254323.1 hypothetical protein A4X06_0g953 [Tilletia controversa]